MAKPEEKKGKELKDDTQEIPRRPDVAPARHTQVPTPGEKAPALTREGGLPQELTEAQRNDVLARVRSVLPAEAEALEAHFKYTDARPLVPSFEKTARDAEIQALKAWEEQVRNRAKELPAHLSYWVTLWENDKHKANPGDRAIPSPEYLGRKILDHLNLSPLPPAP